MFYLRKYQIHFSTVLIYSRNWLIATKGSLTLNLNIVFCIFTCVRKPIFKNDLENLFLKMACFSCIHIIANRDNLNQEFFRIKNSIQIAKKNVNCLIKDLIFFSILWTISPSTNEDHSSKTKQIKSQGIFTLFWQLITHFASQFHQSIYEVALEFTTWRNLFWYIDW